MKQISLDVAKKIRVEIKNELGLNGRQVSVTKRRSLYDTTINVVIKDLNAVKFLNDIDKLAKKYHDVEYDAVTGETLLGGNTFIDVRLEPHIFDDLSQAKLQEAKKVIDEMSIVHFGVCKCIKNNLSGVYDTVDTNGNAILMLFVTDYKCEPFERFSNKIKCRNINQLATALVQYELLGKFVK